MDARHHRVLARLIRRIVAVVCAVVASCAVARAQSAEDGFHPGANGNVYVVVTTGGPFQFIYTDNDTRVSAAVAASQLPTPDLVVSSVQAPATAQEGAKFDLTWTVRLESGEEIHTEHVVNACGLWAREVGRFVGIELPVLAM